MDALCSRFQVIRMASSRFEMVVNAVDDDDGELNEDEVI